MGVNCNPTMDQLFVRPFTINTLVMKKLVVTLTCVCSVLTLFSQIPGGPPARGGRGGMGGAQANIGRFYGKIVDEKNKAIEAASVQLFMSQFDPATRQRKDTIIAGMLTKGNGDFSLENLPLFGNYRLVVTAIGYKTIEQKVAFELKPGAGRDMSQAMAAVDKDLGNIKLEIDNKVLESVTVTGSRPMIEMGIDRKIFNVEKNITSAGGTAVDVMRNVPSINVDIDGNVTLRNAAPQVFVDGRPTTLSLDQIPADAIQSIEIITNPSAKYDASGGQSGILNIVLKKNRKTGYNGGIRAGIDSRARINAGGDLNVRQGKINVFANGNYNQRKSKSWGETDRLNTLLNPPIETIQRNNSQFNGSFAFGRIGLDYFIDNRNTITISQSIVNGDFRFDNRNNAFVDTMGIAEETQYRNTLGKNHFRNYGTQLGFKHLFAQPGKEWTADVTYNRSRNNNHSDIRSRSFYDEAQQNPKTSELLQGVRGGGRNDFLVVQTDFVNPINENMKWEAGLRAQMRTSESFQNNYFNEVFQPGLSNSFEYTDYVYAGYVTFSQKFKDNFSYQVGLRAESSSYDGEQLGKGSYSNSYPISLFPSVFLTRSFEGRQDLQLNYSRRINRPNFFQLMPNTDYSDPLNYNTGNPDLKPEFTHSLELSYQKTYGNNNTFLATVFGKYTTDLISRYQNWGQLGQSNDSAFISTWVNAASAYAAGLELVFRNNWTKWWDMNLSSNVYYSSIKGDNVLADLENDRTSWSAKMNNTFKMPKGWSIQISGEYQGKSALPVTTSNSGNERGGGRGGFMGGPPSTTQGYVDANYGVDMGLRKDIPIKKNTLSVSVNWNDIFRTRRYFVHSEATGFVQDDWRRRDPQIVRLNLNYRFGKFDAALFKRKNMRSEAEGMQNGMQGMQQ
jgi:Outer membrane receptor proteins, mostly Fe transport